MLILLLTIGLTTLSEHLHHWVLCSDIFGVLVMALVRRHAERRTCFLVAVNRTGQILSLLFILVPVRSRHRSNCNFLLIIILIFLLLMLVHAVARYLAMFRGCLTISLLVLLQYLGTDHWFLVYHTWDANWRILMLICLHDHKIALLVDINCVWRLLL